jgi:DNA-binding MarR family transcriptional regulator
MEADRIDSIVAQWVRERPDLDPAPIGVIARISRAARHLEQATDPVFAAYELTSGGFDVLAALRRSGAPFQLTPTALFNQLMLSSGAMTNRIDRLEIAGLVERLPDPYDRRCLLVALTTRGLEVIEAAIAAHLANEARLLAGISLEEREALASLLRKLLLSMEGADQDRRAEASERNGKRRNAG